MRRQVFLLLAIAVLAGPGVALSFRHSAKIQPALDLPNIAIKEQPEEIIVTNCFWGSSIVDPAGRTLECATFYGKHKTQKALGLPAEVCFENGREYWEYPLKDNWRLFVCFESNLGFDELCHFEMSKSKRHGANRNS